MRKLIIWLVVIVVIFLMGVDVVELRSANQYIRYAVCYGRKITPETEKALGINLIGQYKYQLIAAAFLLGFALFMSIDGKS